jgi:hypothetical protein
MQMVELTTAVAARAIASASSKARVTRERLVVGTASREMRSSWGETQKSLFWHSDVDELVEARAALGRCKFGEARAIDGTSALGRYPVEEASEDALPVLLLEGLDGRLQPALVARQDLEVPRCLEHMGTCKLALLALVAAHVLEGAALGVAVALAVARL